MKRFLSLSLCVFMLISVLISAVGATVIVNDDTFLLGDADKSGAVDAKDSAVIKAYVRQFDVFPDPYASDIDADGKTTARDAYYLKCSFADVLSLSDMEGDTQSADFTVAGESVSRMGIVLPAGCTYDDNADFAAEIFIKYIKLATGITVPMTDMDADCKKIVFHDVDYNSELGRKLGIEGYIYEVTEGDLNIYGTYRGNMYAVYEILEDYLGFRFYDDDYTFLYKTRVVDIPEGTYKFVYPEIPIRNVRAEMENQDDHALPLHINSTDHGNTTDTRHGLRAGSQFINAHSFGYYYRMGTGKMGTYGSLDERLLAKYNSGIQKNEFGWQPCASSQYDYSIMFSGMLDTIRRILSWTGQYTYDFSKERLDLGVMSMSFSGCDNIHYCPCKYCAAKATGGRVLLDSVGKTEVLPFYSGQYVVDDGYVKFCREGYSGVYMDLSNRGAVDLQNYYPGLRVHSILYDHVVPDTVRPVKWMNVWYCGTGCNNHWLGSGECYEKGGQLTYADGTGMSNRLDEVSLIEWGKFCREAGAELWFWYYPVTYHYFLCGCPNIFNIYYDYKYLVDKCGCTNLFYEGGGQTYNFEKLKGYLAARMAWDPHMSFERYVEHMKEFLYMYYGDGYEEIYQFILLQEEAGNQCGTCFINNYDRPGDMYSMQYIADHYEEMRALLVTALGKADRDEYRSRLSTLIYCCDFLGLSAVYKSWYVNNQNRALYIERCNNMFGYFNSIHIVVFSDPSTYSLPAAPDFSKDPMTQIYEDGSRRPDGAWGN